MITARKNKERQPMGYVFAIGNCINCEARISFNPARVPSIVHPITGNKEPLCRACANKWNSIHRTSKGLDPVPIDPQAYEPCEEHDLP